MQVTCSGDLGVEGGRRQDKRYEGKKEKRERKKRGRKEGRKIPAEDGESCKTGRRALFLICKVPGARMSRVLQTLLIMHNSDQ